LGQARGEDRSYYEPLNLVAKIYLHKGNQELSLEAYKKALDVFDREGDPDLPPSARSLVRETLSKNIDALQRSGQQK
jgi:hypothetical protein